MTELFERPGDTPAWQAAVRGEPVDWNGLLAGYVATVDWPACAFWRELHDANPDAVVLLSTRASAETWWASIERTIVPALSQPVPADDADRARRRAMTLEMLETRFDRGWRDRDSAIAAYERHNEAVRRAIPAEQLVEWSPGDGWEPLCTALDLPILSAPFPHENTATDFRSAQDLEVRDPKN